jgi:hypothetical protein
MRLPKNIREIIARAARCAAKRRRGRNKRRVYLRTYCRTRALVIRVRKAK